MGLMAMIAFPFLYRFMNNRVGPFCFYQILMAGKTKAFKRSIELTFNLTPMRRVAGNAFPAF